MKEKSRYLVILLEFSVLSLIATVLHYFKNGLDVPGMIFGISCGVIMSIVELKKCFRLARKGVFIYRMSPRAKKIFFLMILLICLLIILLALLFPCILKSYFLEHDIYGPSGTGLLFFGLSFGITAIGIYKLECKYGQKFYIGKAKN